MPKSTIEQIKPEVIKLEGEIIGLWNGIEDEIQSIREKGNLAVVAAWHLGKKLVEMKKLLGHGNFGLWEEKIGIPSNTASRYMILAAKYSKVEDLPDNKREGYLAIGVLPDKETITHDGNIQLKPTSHYLSIVNRFQNWRNQVTIGKLTFDDEAKQKAREDFKPVFAWLKELYGE